MISRLKKNADSSYDIMNRSAAIIYINGEIVEAHTHAIAINEYLERNGLSTLYGDFFRPDMDFDRSDPDDLIGDSEILNKYVKQLAFAHKLPAYEINLETDSLFEVDKNTVAYALKKAYPEYTIYDDNNFNEITQEFRKIARLKKVAGVIKANAYDWVQERAEHIREKNQDMDEGMEYGIAWKQYKKKHPKWKSKKQKEKKKKTAELYEAYNDDFFMDEDGSGIEYVEVFKNPSSREISDTIKNDRFNSIRGIIYDDGTYFVWPGNIVHDAINDMLSDKIDINNGLRFCWDTESNDWLIDVRAKYTNERVKELIRKHKIIFEKIGNINAEFILFDLANKVSEEKINGDSIFNPENKKVSRLN